MSPKTQGLLWQSFAYVMAFIVGYLTYQFSHNSGETIFWSTFWANIAGTFVIFAFSYIFKNSSYYDPYWSLIPAVLAFAWFLTSDFEGDAARVGAVLSLSTAYAIRLTLNWARFWPGLHHQDWRYDDIKSKTGAFYWLVSLLGIHMFPTIQTWLGSIPMYAALTDGSKAFGWLDIIALFVTAFAIALALAADEQMHRFRANPENKGKVNTLGLWAYSRHPNYIGETLFWVGLCLFGIAAAPQEWKWMLPGSVAMFLMFHFISIPMMETRSKQRRPGYEAASKGIWIYFPFLSGK